MARMSEAPFPEDIAGWADLLSEAGEAKYELTDEELREMVSRVSPVASLTEEQTARVRSVQGAALAFGLGICQSIPKGRERSLALTKLEECVGWTVAGIARDPS